MVDSPRSSFIPKQSSGAISPTVKRRRKFNVFSFVASVILIGSLILAVGTFFYKDYSNKQLIEQKQALEAERNRFSESDIAAIKEFDRRLMAAEFLLDQHLMPSKIFDVLEFSTKETIQFASMDFSRDADGEPEILLAGLTEEFASVALQALEFNGNPVTRQAVFTGLNTTDTIIDGSELIVNENTELPRVSFSVEGTIAASSIAFDGAQPDAPQNTSNGATTTGS